MSHQPALAPSPPPSSPRWASSQCLQCDSSLVQAEGKVVLALEGGYTGPGVAESVLHCLRALLGEPCQLVLTKESGPLVPTQVPLQPILHRRWQATGRSSLGLRSLFDRPLVLA